MLLSCYLSYFLSFFLFFPHTPVMAREEVVGERNRLAKPQVDAPSMAAARAKKKIKKRERGREEVTC